MDMRLYGFLLFFIISICLMGSCGKNDPEPGTISIVSITSDGSRLTDGAENLSVRPVIEMVFSSALDPAGFRSALSVSAATGTVSVEAAFSNQASRITLEPVLAYNTSYMLTISDAPIGIHGGSLEDELSISFTTREDGTIHSMPPCTSASGSCLHTINLSAAENAVFSFYSSFPIYENSAEWTGITGAIVVVHGASRNPDDYFNHVMGALTSEDLDESIVLIAPYYKNEVEAAAGDLYWKGTDWREGANSISEAGISSYAALDTIIGRLADRDHFPVLENVIVTGQSSGGCFTHLYAAANSVEGAFPSISFDYVVSESQYFYYPDGRRINESTNQLYMPTGCAGYDIWPIGYKVLPPVLAPVTKEVFNDRFVNRSIIYLLGNGDEVDGALNTRDCHATLLGSTRYRRGKHMFRYMELVYPGEHNHRVEEVNGVTHDGSAMYGSDVFSTLIKELLGL